MRRLLFDHCGANSKEADKASGQAQHEEPEVAGRLRFGNEETPDEHGYDDVRAPADVA